MKYIALALLISLALIVATAALVRRLTSNRSLAQQDSLRSRNENAAAMAQRFAAKRPHRALALGLLNREGTSVEAAGKTQADRPVDGATVFELGSVSKVFTGFLLARMVEAGEVELSWRLGDVLRGARLSESAADITLLQLATHTSGLPRLPGDLSKGENREDPYAHYTRERLLASLETVQVTPSTTSDYSNYGVGLLGEALAINRDSTYPELLRERVLDPLGLGSGSLGELGAPPSEDLIEGFMGKKPASPWTLPALAGAGGLRLSTDDLLRFLSALASPADEWRGARDLMWQVHHRDGDSTVGLAWQIEGEGDDRILWHNGSTYGASSYLAYRPSTGLGVAAVQNFSELVGMMVGNSSAAETIGRALMADSPKG